MEIHKSTIHSVAILVISGFPTNHILRDINYLAPEKTKIVFKRVHLQIIKVAYLRCGCIICERVTCEILPTTCSGVVAAAKIWVSKLGVGGAPLDPHLMTTLSVISFWFKLRIYVFHILPKRTLYNNSGLFRAYNAQSTRIFSITQNPPGQPTCIVENQ